MNDRTGQQTHYFAVGLAGPVTAITPAGLAPPIPPWECDETTHAPLAAACDDFDSVRSSHSPLTLRAAGDSLAAPPARPSIIMSAGPDDYLPKPG